MDPVVYFQCYISCDEEPEWILERVSFEWAQIRGNRLEVKQLSSFLTRPAVTLYYVRNNANISTLAPELKQMLEETRDKAFEEVEEFFGAREVPEFMLNVQMPKITGQNTQQFQGWSAKLAQDDPRGGGVRQNPVHARTLFLREGTRFLNKVLKS